MSSLHSPSGSLHRSPSGGRWGIALECPTRVQCWAGMRLSDASSICGRMCFQRSWGSASKLQGPALAGAQGLCGVAWGGRGWEAWGKKGMRPSGRGPAACVKSCSLSPSPLAHIAMISKLSRTVEKTCIYCHSSTPNPRALAISSE